MHYLLLAAAIATEILATTMLKLSKGFTQLIPTIVCIVSYIFCYIAFAKAVEKINLGIAYATWCGIGIVATTLISFFIFQEKISLIGLYGIALIITGCILLNVFVNH